MPKTCRLFCVRVADSGRAVVDHWKAHALQADRKVLAVFTGMGTAPEPVILVIYRCLKSKWSITPGGKAALLSPRAGAWAC